MRNICAILYFSFVDCAIGAIGAFWFRDASGGDGGDGTGIAAMRNGILEARFAEIPPQCMRESVISSLLM